MRPGFGGVVGFGFGWLWLPRLASNVVNLP